MYSPLMYSYALFPGNGGFFLFIVSAVISAWLIYKLGRRFSMHYLVFLLIFAFLTILIYGSLWWIFFVIRSLVIIIALIVIFGSAVYLLLRFMLRFKKNK